MQTLFFESVQAGFPSPAQDDLKHSLSLEEYLIEQPLTTIFGKVKGDSMTGANIAEGDGVIVDKGKKVREGDIVIAEVDNEYTLKYYYTKQGKPYLKPANPNYPIITPKHSLSVFGVVVGVFRKCI